MDSHKLPAWIEPKIFERASDEGDVLNQFYIPALSNSTKYRYLACSFSSNALAVAALDLSGLIRNEGRMELVVGVKLRKVDVWAIREGMEASA